MWFYWMEEIRWAYKETSTKQLNYHVEVVILLFANFHKKIYLSTTNFFIGFTQPDIKRKWSFILYLTFSPQNSVANKFTMEIMTLLSFVLIFSLIYCRIRSQTASIRNIKKNFLPNNSFLTLKYFFNFETSQLLFILQKN